VVRAREVVAQLDAAVLREHGGDGEAVAERLAHLLAGGRDPRVVHPVGGKPLAGGAGLGLLVLMVREAQIHAATVDVEGVAEIFAGHRRALDVPAGSTAAPRGGPG